MRIIRPNPLASLSRLADELRENNNPARAKARKQREARKLAYLQKLGVIPKRATKREIAAAWALYGAPAGSRLLDRETVLARLRARASAAQETENTPAFDDDIPF